MPRSKVRATEDRVRPRHIPLTDGSLFWETESRFAAEWNLSMRHGSTIAPAFFALGLLLAGWNAAGLAGEPLDDRLGIRTAPIMLLLRSDVQADLQLDAQQVALCRRAAQALYQRALAIKGQTGPGADAARREINQQQTNALRQTLNPEQLDRL